MTRSSSPSSPPVRVALALLLLPLLPALATGLWHPRRPDWTRDDRAGLTVYVEQALTWQPPPLWVDARPAAEYEREHVAGAVSAPADAPWEQTLSALIDVWDPTQRIVVYCGSEDCGLSREVASRLRRDLGTPDVFALQGGWAAWKERKP